MTKRKSPQSIRLPDDLLEMLGQSIEKRKCSWSSEVIRRLYSTFKKG